MTEHSAKHLTELEIYELATGEAVAASSEAHAETCEACGAEVADTRRLLGTVERLDEEIEPPGSLERRLAARLRDEGPRSRRVAGWWRAAAAVLLFAAGAGAHALWTDVDHGPMPGPDAVPPVLAAQRAGTDYVSAIARLVADSSRLTETERRLGRDVGLAAIVGAAYELRLLSPEDGVTEEIHRLTRTAWIGEGER